MHTGENCTSSASIFIFMKSLYSSHLQGQRHRTDRASHQGILWAMSLSGYFTWSQMDNSIWWWEDKALILPASVIRNQRDRVRNKQCFFPIPTLCHMVSLCTNTKHAMPGSLWKVEYAWVSLLWCHFITALWWAVITHLLIVHHF